MQTKTPFFTKKLGISKALTPNLYFFISNYSFTYFLISSTISLIELTCKTSS